MVWESDKKNFHVNTFKECYEKVIKPRGLYDKRKSEEFKSVEQDFF